MRYDAKVVDHYENPRNVGAFDVHAPNVGTGVVGSPACGDVIKLQILVEEDHIQDACFKTFGCGSAIAVSSLVTERLRGKTLDEALLIRNAEISAYLDLPAIKRHCSVLAEEAIAAAIQDFRNKQSGASLEKGHFKPLTMTARAIEKAQAFLDQKPAAKGLRISVTRQGCAGLSYVFDYAVHQSNDDMVTEVGGVTLLVDPLVMPFLQGTEIDYVEENLKAGFVFHNPNACAQCACGNSFRTTDQENTRDEPRKKCGGSRCC
jgi:nitrogen fixation NifU-like protein